MHPRQPRDDRDARLEGLVGRLLADLPPVPAPASLERRVEAEIRRRAALPWWRRSFAQWPSLVRAGFVAASVVLIGLVTLGGVRPGHPSWARVLLAWAFDRAQTISSLLSSADATAALVARLVPVEWVRIALAVGVVFYVVLFGLGATAYRLLYLEPREVR